MFEDPFPCFVDTNEDEEQFIQNFFRELHGEDYGERDGDSVDGLLRRWSRLPIVLRKGWTGGMDSYMARLGTRSVLQDLIDVSPPSLRRKIEVVVSPIDEEFKALTSERSTPIIDYYCDNPQHWWHFREPIPQEGVNLWES